MFNFSTTNWKAVWRAAYAEYGIDVLDDVEFSLNLMLLSDLQDLGVLV